VPEIFRSARRERVQRVLPPRPSPRARGYDAKWDRRAAAYRRRNPFCERCAEVEDGPSVFGAMVDHKFPVQDGGKVHCSDAGLWTLCRSCHGWKTELEAYARRTDQMDQIVEWCDHPASRPIFRRGDMK